MSSSLPNIVLIYPDQMRYDATSRSGNKLVKTPAFDALAEAGAYFENAYTSFPLCCPFRASLMSGAYAHSIGMCTNHYPINLNWPFEISPPSERRYRVLLNPRKPLKIRQFIHAKVLWAVIEHYRIFMASRTLVREKLRAKHRERQENEVAKRTVVMCARLRRSLPCVKPDN